MGIGSRPENAAGASYSCTAGRSIAINKPMIAVTTNSSISVMPCLPSVVRPAVQRFNWLGVGFLLSSPDSFPSTELRSD